MKRLSAIILIIILCLSTTLSLAESKDGITFRNIPWESSIDDVLAILKKEFGKNITYKSEFERTRVGDESYYVIHYKFEIPDLKVAGFPVTCDYDDNYPNLELFFIPNLDESKSSYSQDQGRLIGAKYPYISSEKLSFNSMSAELEKKLNGIYGNAENRYGEDWSKKWTKDDAYILGDTEDQAIRYKQGIITITTYEPGGCSLFYVYSSETIKSEHTIISDIHKREQEEKWEREQREREEQQKKEEEERGTDGL
jgi:hypothetical protein